MNFQESIRLPFDRLPLWQGVQSRHESLTLYPFALGWDDDGFIRQTTPAVIQEQVIKQYADSEYSFITAPPGASAWANSLAEDYLKYVMGLCGSVVGKSILEIGAGSTYLAKRFTEELGASRYLIVDPSVKDQPGGGKIRVSREYFGQGELPDEEFDFVLSRNCFEHVPNPGRFLEDIRAVACKNQALAIMVFPDIERQFLTGDLNALIHEHISYFTKSTATQLFERKGFEVTHSMSRGDGLYFSLTPRTESVRSDQPRVPSSQDLERIAEPFAKSMKAMSELVQGCIDQKMRMGFHGATNGLNNFLATSGLGDSENIFVFDNDETKVGKFIPACKYPIRASVDPSYKTMDRVIISAMTFYDQIWSDLTTKIGIDPSRIQPYCSRVSI